MAATAAAKLAAATSSLLRRSQLLRPHVLRVSRDFAPRRFVRHIASSTNEEAAARAAAVIADMGGPTIFDKIIAKEIPSSIVYEDEKVLAFRDINPQAPVHVLVIPKLRDGLTGLDKAEPRHADILGQLLYAAKVVAEKEGVADGYRVVINNGAEGCQSVYHLHVHVLGGRQMKWPPGEISAQDMFEAATHTTYIALDYAMAELMRKPHLMSKLQTEVRRCRKHGKEVITQQDLNGMTYLRAVMKETLRLHPPGPLLVPHYSMADCEVDGYIIPSRTRVVLNVWALGRDTSCWQSPEEFMPERFLEEAMDAASDFHGNDFRFLPFGSGRRICPAIGFATITFEIILANLVYHFNWEQPAGLLDIDMTEVFGLDVHRKERLLLIPCISDDT